MLKELSTDIMCLVEDQNGNHVIQKCIETIPSEKLKFIIEQVTEKVPSFSFPILILCNRSRDSLSMPLDVVLFKESLSFQLLNR